MNVSDLRKALVKSGARFTRQRAAIYDYLCSVDSHPTAAEVCTAAREEIPNLSLATVYKALEALVGAGVAIKVADGDGPARYDARSDAHYHMRCTKTGRVRDLPISFDPHLLEKLSPGLKEQLRLLGFEVTGYRLELLGHFNDG